MSRSYIESHFDAIRAHASDVEKRMEDDGCTAEWLMEENEKELHQCQLYGCDYVLIDSEYRVDMDLNLGEEA